MDITLTQWLNSFANHNTIFDLTIIAITQYGVPLMIILVALHWWSRDRRQLVRHDLVTAGLAFLAGEALNQLILLFIHRPRPYTLGLTHLIIPESADWSFPSDHATAVAAVLAAFLFRKNSRMAWLVLPLATLVCVSRVVVGTHYVSDIAGGILTGVVAAAMVSALYRPGTKLDRLVTGIL